MWNLRPISPSPNPCLSHPPPFTGPPLTPLHPPDKGASAAVELFPCSPPAACCCNCCCWAWLRGLGGCEVVGVALLLLILLLPATVLASEPGRERIGENKLCSSEVWLGTLCSTHVADMMDVCAYRTQPHRQGTITNSLHLGVITYLTVVWPTGFFLIPGTMCLSCLLLVAVTL